MAPDGGIRAGSGRQQGMSMSLSFFVSYQRARLYGSSIDMSRRARPHVFAFLTLRGRHSLAERACSQHGGGRWTRDLVMLRPKWASECRSGGNRSKMDDDGSDGEARGG